MYAPLDAAPLPVISRAVSEVWARLIEIGAGLGALREGLEKEYAATSAVVKGERKLGPVIVDLVRVQDQHAERVAGQMTDATTALESIRDVLALLRKAVAEPKRSEHAEKLSEQIEVILRDFAGAFGDLEQNYAELRGSIGQLRTILEKGPANAERP